AKQVVMQRIKDAERDVIFEEFINRENEIITGQIQRSSKNNVYIDLGKIEGILPPTEQIPGEVYNQGDRLKLLISEVKKTTKGPQIILSRASASLVKRLFEIEVPEIVQGIVEIYSIAREAGSRTKIAVFSKNQEVDPLGACVGFKGTRVKAIVDELNGEKIDIVIWSKKI
ncbi:S1 RNA-binding domain-containing protein, partial [Vibrio parahaemolyticus]|nr:S1 RNA-binding domain-containing protein [Vibrio parahaemolyticus]